MRAVKANGPLSVHVISGTHVVLFGINLEKTSRHGVLGFGIQRKDLVDKEKPVWLEGFKSFKQSRIPRGKLVRTNKQPIQAFLWGDYTARKDHEYEYRIVAMRGEPGDLTESEDVSVIAKMDKEANAKNSVYFNRGVAGSQAYVKKFQNKKPEKVGQKAFDWLSRGLLEALVSFIRQAKNESWTIHAAVYEFQYVPILKEFKSAIDRGVKVMIVFDDKDRANGPGERNKTAMSVAQIPETAIKPRKADSSYIPHNKFIVLLKNNTPKQVWTGSTNFTIGGIFGHSNVGHIIRDEQVAKAYELYWQELFNDHKAKQLRTWNDENHPLPIKLKPESIVATFSPRRTLEVLEWYAAIANKANTALFLTAAFGVHDLFEKVFSEKKNLLRYLMLESEDNNMKTLLSWKYNKISIGNVLEENMFEHWLKEKLTSLNNHVKYIHTKYLLIDPLSDDPIVITGSANFSNASTKNNDENMLIIRGDTQVADIYLTEFMRLFMHFYYRTIVKGIGFTSTDPDKGFLKGDDSWSLPYYKQDTQKYRERLYFAG